VTPLAIPESTSTETRNESSRNRNELALFIKAREAAD
jgi:hypothetical protein